MFFSDCFTQKALNLEVVLLIDRLTLREEFMMHYAIQVEEHSRDFFNTPRIFKNIRSLNFSKVSYILLNIKGVNPN